MNRELPTTEIPNLSASSDFMRRMSETTTRETMEIGLKNAQANKGLIEKTIKDLGRELSVSGIGKPALIISGGPSLHRTRALATLKEEGFPGYVVAADGALGHCLRSGIVPDFVLSVDPDAHRIVRWFGDTKLHTRPKDDYFARQDLDPYLNTDEVKKNDELVELVTKFGPQIKAILSTSVSPDIPERCKEAGMVVYWWNPLYDDFEDPKSYSRVLYRETKAPCMTTGGNVGSSCWAFAQAVLQSDPVLMVGMDFAYLPGTPVEKTQYYYTLKELYPDSPEKGLIHIHNPHLDETWPTDPAYYWYSLCFRQMLEAAGGRTINCTQGGILFGPDIQWSPFREALRNLRVST